MLLFSTDIDGTVYDSDESAELFATFWESLQGGQSSPLLVYNTGRSIEDTIELIKRTPLPRPDYIIGGVGTKIIDFRHDVTIDNWDIVLSENWNFDEVRETVRNHCPTLEPQPDECQNPHKCSWFWHDKSVDEIAGLRTALEDAGLETQVVYSSDRDLDILPRKANKGNAIAWLAGRLEIPLDEIVVAGDSGNDLSMFLVGKSKGIVVSNAEAALLDVASKRGAFIASLPCAAGVVEGIQILTSADAPSAGQTQQGEKPHDLYFVHISIHGLIRGENLELGRDADTGGQCKYVLELVKAMAEHEQVGQVDLFTRRVIDAKVSPDYAVPVEPLGNGAFIKRIKAGPRRYLRKEALWRYLDAFVDQSLALFRANGRLPDIIHAHYADAGYVGSRLASLLGCPFVFTGHSLGRSKLERLLEGAPDKEKVERRYNLSARIEAEELSLDTAVMVCTSTHQEVEKQYSVYEFYAPDRMKVIPPGVDVSRFSPPGSAPVPDEVVEKIERFLDDPNRPVIISIARADEKKNLASLVRAFGESETLRKRANLIIVAGNRDRIADLNPGARKVWTELLQLIDDYDLYGCISIPKHHQPDEIPAFYRYAASKEGIFVNPALMEPFGLTIIEAAASGLPVLATNDGGPRDILGNCKNGELIDPVDVPALTEKLERAIGDSDLWKQWSEAGLKGVNEHYTWKGHVDRYLEEASDLLVDISQPNLITEKIRTSLPLKDRIMFCGLENELLDGDEAAISRIRELTNANQPTLGFGIVTGRSIEMARELVERHNLPEPDVYITQLGAEIHYGKRLIVDEPWEKHLAHRWEPEAIMEVLEAIDGLSIQPETGRQHQFKISYDYVKGVAPRRKEIQKLLRENNLPVKVILSEGQLLDVIPLRSGKGQAIRYVTMRWGIPADRVLFYARRGSDYEALSGQFLGVLGSDHCLELKSTTSLPRVYLAHSPNFMGLLEGIEAYHFDGDIKIPESARGLQAEESENEEAVLSPDMVVHNNDGE